jgi:RNA polymerase sigma-70 factor, ECF subfamily
MDIEQRDRTGRSRVIGCMGLATKPLPELPQGIASVDVKLTPVSSAGEALFEDLYQTRYRDVYRYSMLMLRGSDDAEDVVAETFQRAYSALRSGRVPSGDPLPWLLLIARRIVLNQLRRRRLISWFPLALLPASREPRYDGTGEGAEFWMWFEALSDVLPDRQREALILRYQRDLDDGQIGSILGLSASGVRSLVARAIASLRNHPEIWS